MVLCLVFTGGKFSEMSSNWNGIFSSLPSPLWFSCLWKQRCMFYECYVAIRFWSRCLNLGQIKRRMILTMERKSLVTGKMYLMEWWDCSSYPYCLAWEKYFKQLYEVEVWNFVVNDSLEGKTSTGYERLTFHTTSKFWADSFWS